MKNPAIHGLLGIILPLLLLACGDTFTRDDDDTLYGEDDDSADDDSVGDDDTSGPNNVPTAIAGDTAYIDLGDTAELDGSDSSDPDGDSLEFSWELTSEPQDNTAVLIDADTEFPTITPDVTGAFQATLTVTDPGGLSDSDQMSIWVAAGNEAPIADAGGDQTVDQGDTVQLDGSGSQDPNGDSLDFYWSVVSYPGSAPTLSNGTSPIPSFSAADLGVYVLDLVVNDGVLSSAPDTVEITVEEAGGDDGGCFSCYAYVPGDPHPNVQLSISGQNQGRAKVNVPLLVFTVVGIVALLRRRL